MRPACPRLAQRPTRLTHSPLRRARRALPWVFIGALVSSGCDWFEPSGKSAAPSPTASAPPVKSGSAPTGLASGSPVSSATPQASAAPSEAPPHPGPWLIVLAPSAAVYSKPGVERSAKLGYVQSGARLPVLGKPKPGDKCNEGWLELVGGGYICGNAGTLNEKESRAKFTIRRPDLTATLPYTYARNAKNGTPLYRTVPTKSQMLEYEPYLKKDKEKAEADGTATTKPAATTADGAVVSAGGAANRKATEGTTPPQQPGPTSSAQAASADAGVPEGVPEEQPWWQQDGVDDKLHRMKLSDLKDGADGILVQRMVRGFYIAVDRTFTWNGRTWYKSTKGLVAPADRMGQAAPSDFRGVELGAEVELPVGWVYGGREKTQTYEIDLEKKKVKVIGTVERFVALPLTEETYEEGKVVYRKLKNGQWVRKAHLRITEPGPAPTDVKETEHWVDVDLSSQTLVLFEGQRPIYATLMSSGKSSRTKAKDHSTPTGQWRIREKHVTATMDGDGTDAGDQPYSIEDVPFVMYFHKSYAVHGAFWHRNYGAQMSHGCVNLAPLDAKFVFSKTEPYVSEQWHGAWSSESTAGSWVVVHD